MSDNASKAGEAPTEGDGNVDSTRDSKPRGVSLTSWQKFQMLKKQRKELTDPTTVERTEKMKSDIMDNVRASFSMESDREILKERGIDLDGITKQEEIAEGSSTSGGEGSHASHEDSSEETASHKDGPKTWSEVKLHLGAHDHLKGVDRGKHAPKTELEEKIDAAVAAGDYEKAEQLSDHLANRDFGKRIADAFDAARFSEKRKKEEDIKNAKKKKKLAWGFEHKERWEMKGNM